MMTRSNRDGRFMHCSLGHLIDIIECLEASRLLYTATPCALVYLFIAAHIFTKGSAGT